MNKIGGSVLRRSALSVVIAATLGAGQAVAQDAADASAITAQDLLKLLIDEGVIDKSKVQALTEKLKNRQRATAGAAVESTSLQSKDVKPASEAGVVRVPYVPKYIKDEIRDQVRIGLKEDVSRDVMAQAKLERWGLPGALPEWVGRIQFSGDMRLREQSDMFAGANSDALYLDINEVNSIGDVDSLDEAAFLNTTEDRNRLRARARLGMKAKITNEYEVGMRLVTGKRTDPVSTNQTLASYGDKYETTFDLAYVAYKSYDKSLAFSGGRIKNPFLSTDLVWDNDLTFEGVAGSWYFMRGDSIADEFRQADPYVTLGAFPLAEIEQSNQDKWLYAGQVGFDYEFINQSKLRLGLAYYHYDNIAGVRNALNSELTDYTAPHFVQKGNSLFNIRNSADSSLVLLGLLPDFQLLNFTVDYDIAVLAPYHIYLTADYVENIGFDEDEIVERRGSAIDKENKGWSMRVAVGWPNVAERGNWQAAMTYRYLERDAVLDAFTDSDFHLGGTDAKGYTLEFQYGLATDIWMVLKWISSDELKGDLVGGGGGPYGIDTLQLDLNTKF